MTMNLFDQFAAPHLLGMTLLPLALMLPPLLLLPSPRLTPNRMLAIQTWFTTTLTKHLLTPLTLPGRTWALPLMTIFCLLLITNLLGLLPYTFTPTTQLSLNMALAAPLWLMTTLLGLRTQPTMALAHMLPTGTPPLLIPALIIIETISQFIRPLALGVRLTANLTAGHLLITLISTAVLFLPPLSSTLAALISILLILLTGLEVAVAMIQAYVFVLLLSLYLQENT